MKAIRFALLITIACIAATTIAQENEEARPADRSGSRERMSSRGQKPTHGGDPASAMRREGLSLARLASNERVAQELGLSAEQVKALKDGAYELKKEEIKLRAKQELAAMEQIKLMGEDDIDEAALMKAVEKTAAISTELAKLAVRQILLVKKTLTKEQLTQMRAMMRKHMQERAKAMHRERNGGPGQRGRSEERSKRGRPEGRDRRTPDRDEGERADGDED